MNIRVNVADLYTTLAGNKTKTGFIAHPVTLESGQKVVGLYRGFGRTVMVRRAPGAWEKGFRTLEPIQSDVVWIKD